jgi:DNA-binding CsgD family transcriptional regulator
MVSVLHGSAVVAMVGQGQSEARPASALPPDRVLSAVASAEVDDPLVALARDHAQALDADALLITWQTPASAPVALYAGGAGLTREWIDRLVVEQAAHPARAPREWRPESEGDEGGARLLTAFPAGDGVVTITTLFARPSETARRRAEAEVARRQPLLEPFFALWAQRARAQAQARGLAEAVSHSDVGVLLVNARGQLMLANAVAEALMARQDGLRRSGTLLSGSRLPDTLRLQTAIDHVVGGGTSRARAAAPVIALGRAERRPLLVAIVATDQPPATAEDCAAILYVFDPAQELRRLIEPVCKLYGLSPVETRLTCLLADALSLADAAAAMHVREQTARSYLKQIFLKTDTNRQAELVWLMLKSAVRVAPICRTSFV